MNRKIDWKKSAKVIKIIFHSLDKKMLNCQVQFEKNSENAFLNCKNLSNIILNEGILEIIDKHY